LANTRSAEKRNRQTQKRRVRNLHVRTGMKTAVRKVREALLRGDAAGARQALLEAARTVDRASSKGVVHRNAAARKISRLARAVAKAAPGAK
jgi:small subunit ribosomal protein S20